MTPEKCQEVIDLYREKFRSREVPTVDYDHDAHANTANPYRTLGHCNGMLDKMEVFIQEGRIDKVYRWLGFIQGVLWASGVYTLTELMGHNRKDS